MKNSLIFIGLISFFSIQAASDEPDFITIMGQEDEFFVPGAVPGMVVEATTVDLEDAPTGAVGGAAASAVQDDDVSPVAQGVRARAKDAFARKFGSLEKQIAVAFKDRDRLEVELQRQQDLDAKFKNPAYKPTGYAELMAMRQIGRAHV